MRRAGVALLLALAAGPAPAQEGSDRAPESAPSPVARPALLPPEEGQAAASPENDPQERPALIPPEEMPGAAPAEGEAPADAASEEPAGPPLREVLAESPQELSACRSELDALGVAHERADPVTDEGNPDCGMANPLIVTALAPGVALEPASSMRCATALAGARWVADVVLPLSRKLEGRGALVAVDQGTAYLCRPRADGDLSEHALGNALDVMGFRFESGDPIPVQPRAGDGTLEEAFQRAVSAGACLDFTTVLAPGSDADHADHLHLDVKARKGGFRICE